MAKLFGWFRRDKTVTEAAAPLAPVPAPQAPVAPATKWAPYRDDHFTPAPAPATRNGAYDGARAGATSAIMEDALYTARAEGLYLSHGEQIESTRLLNEAYDSGYTNVNRDEAISSLVRRAWFLQTDLARSMATGFITRAYEAGYRNGASVRAGN